MTFLAITILYIILLCTETLWFIKERENSANICIRFKHTAVHVTEPLEYVTLKLIEFLGMSRKGGSESLLHIYISHIERKW